MADWRLLCEAWAVLLWVRLYLANMPFARWRRHLLSEPSMQPSLEHKQLGLRVAGMVALAARNHICEMRCLHQSIALQRLLKRRSVDTQLCIGVRKSDGVLDGHAWVKAGDHILNDRADVDRYYVIFRELQRH